MDKDKLKNKIVSFLQQQNSIYGDNLYLEKAVKDLKDTSNKSIAINQNPVNVMPKEKAPEAKKENLQTINENWAKVTQLDDLYDQIHDCKKCPLGESRTKFVFGSGNPNADIMIIGEAPGRDEDLQGLPFVGRAGQLLTKILEAINLSRDEVFIANIIKCRPPNNRTPEKQEVDHCEPYLKKQIELIKPQFILALGLTAVNTLTKQRHKMGDIRGNMMSYHDIKMLVTYHPAALLRNPNWKKATWDDVRLLRKLYDEYLQNK